MRILHVINDLSVGGTEHLLVKHVQQLGLAEGLWESQVVVLGSPDSASAEYLKRLPSPPTFLGFSGRYRAPISTAMCLWRLRRVIDATKPDLIHSYLWTSNVFCDLARRGLGVPHVVHVVDRRGDRQDRRLLARTKVRLTGALLAQGGARFASVSEACREHAVQQWRISPERVVTAHNGIPVAEFDIELRPPVANPPVLGTISNFAEEKGHCYLFEAVALLRDRGLRLEVRVAGGGSASDKASLDACVLRHGITDQVRFVGRVPSATAFYREIDVFVIPSIFAEGLPTTILEAMAARLPVVATDVGGAVEAVRDGIEGLIVPPRNPEALAKAIASLVAAPARMQAIGEAGARRVRDLFSIERMTSTIMNRIYRPLVMGSAGK